MRRFEKSKTNRVHNRGVLEMKSSLVTRIAASSGAAAALGFAALPAWAQDAAPAAAAAPVPLKGDTAFMFVCTIIVLLMIVPGLALFYGGMVRTKNMLSMLMQVFTITCMVAIVWVTYGYSMAFTDGGVLGAYVGGFSKLFLAGVTAESTAETFTSGVVLPEYLFICFQMTFACITSALIVGSVAERMKFSAVLLFVLGWVTFSYFPIAHMVWYGEGMLFKLGALDFAGGTVVHINAGIAGIVGAIMVGKRVGYGREMMPPHSLTMTMIGAALLWFGWFGFNCGSNLEANGIAILAMVNTFVATATAGLAWILAEWLIKGKPSLLGLASGVVAGLVAVTPACGLAGPMGSIVLGFVSGVVCFFFCTGIKNALGYDDSLDVFGVHCIGGIIGSLATGVLAASEFGGVGLADNVSIAGQVSVQATAVALAIVWSGVVSLILYKIVDILVGLRPVTDKEREGLDIIDHGERAYNY
jgi:ammonium transporter, Amt family